MLVIIIIAGCACDNSGNALITLCVRAFVRAYVPVCGSRCVLLNLSYTRHMVIFFLSSDASSALPAYGVGLAICRHCFCYSLPQGAQGLNAQIENIIMP